MNKKIVLISHGRIAETATAGQKFSEVWTEIVAGARKEARESRIHLRILSPSSYHDHAEFVGLVKKAIRSDADYLIFPFTPMEKEVAATLIKKLKEFRGKIVAVNVPPTPEIRKQLENIVGYAGMNEQEAGRLAALWLVSRIESMGIRKIIVPKHEKGHYGHYLRITGVKGIADAWHIKVEELYVGAEAYKLTRLRKGLEDERVGVVTLGVRGTEAVLKTGIDVPIVGMDLNQNVRSAIKESKVLASLIQHPFKEGALAVRMAMENSGEYTERYCGPTLVTRDNIEVF